MLGDNILGRGFHFDIQLVEGAGAFVCGEETALIASLEGFAGRPRPASALPRAEGTLRASPPTSTTSRPGTTSRPSSPKGPAWFSETGSTKSAGTKVFSLVGKINNTGLVEMPLGTPLKTFIYDVGEGGSDGKPIKAVQTGGPSGGCIPQEMFDTPVDYETLAQLGSIMGSGGMVVMDEDNCMVDVARYFIEFTHSESCGKCVPCRVGLDQVAPHPERLHARARRRGGSGPPRRNRPHDPRHLALRPGPDARPIRVLTTMRHFRHEFEDHIRAKRCRAGVCEDLALSPCENSCPLHMNIPRFLQLYKEGPAGRRVRSGGARQPAARLHRPRLPASVRRPLPPAARSIAPSTCARCTASSPTRFLLSDRFDALAERIAARKLPPTGPQGGGGGRRARGSHRRLLPGAARTRSHASTNRIRRPAACCATPFPSTACPKRDPGAEVELIRRLGVKFVFGVAVGTDITLNDLDNQYNAVFLAIGTWKEAWVYLPGTELKGVIPALPFLEAVAKGEPVRARPQAWP